MKKILQLSLVVLLASCTGPKVIVTFDALIDKPDNALTSDEIQHINVKPDNYAVVSSIPYLDESLKSLKQSIDYPQEAIQHKIEGIVLVDFIILEDGSTSDINLVKRIGYGCDEAVLNAVQNLTFINEAEMRFKKNLKVEFKL